MTKDRLQFVKLFDLTASERDSKNKTAKNLESSKIPPDILDYPTSADMVLDEGSSVSLRCIAHGSPEPFITWKREDGKPLRLHNGSEELEERNKLRGKSKISIINYKLSKFVAPPAQLFCSSGYGIYLGMYKVKERKNIISMKDHLN
ncbi:hypothetical protein NQ317_015314 [Molorchus minor]|uniref:Ig-like domain-containing protein n=1 Tax=Molorchus minor TaxID=1323400 RepID=A0ABQ9JCG1_9CUCU|nr:hypothetical protein NQ317_015314 [Molorchus minor]